MLHWALFFFLVSILAGFNGNTTLSAVAGNLSAFTVALFFGMLAVAAIGAAVGGGKPKARI